MRIPDLDTIAKAAEVASKAIADLPRRDPRAIVVRRYLWAMERVRWLVSQARLSRKRKRTKVADRQQVRAEEWHRKAEALRPLVEVVMRGETAPEIESVARAVEGESEDAGEVAEAIDDRTLGLFDEDEAEEVA